MIFQTIHSRAGVSPDSRAGVSPVRSETAHPDRRDAGPTIVSHAAAAAVSPTRLSLRRNFAWTGAANAVYAGCQWAILVALAKAGSAAMVGQFALGLAVTAPVFMFANLQLRSLQATDAAGHYAFADYLGLRLLTTVIAQLVVVGIVAVGGYDNEAFWVILAMGATRMLDSLSDVAYGQLQQKERLDRVSRSMMLRGVLSVVAVPAAVACTGRLVDGVLAMAVAWALVLLFYDLPLAARCATASQKPCDETSPDTASAKLWHTFRVMPRFHFRTLARLSWLALPLGFVTFLSSLNANVPRYFVESCVGEAELGVFAGLMGLFSAVYFVQVAIGQAALPRLAQYHAAGMGNRYLRLGAFVLGITLASGMAGVVLAFVGGADVLRIVYSDEFARHADFFRWLSIAAAGQGLASALGYFLTTARRFHQIAGVGLLATLTTSLCSAWLIPRWGLAGAAWVVLAGPLVACALYSVPFVLLLKSMLESPRLVGSPAVPEHAAGV